MLALIPYEGIADSITLNSLNFFIREFHPALLQIDLIYYMINFKIIVFIRHPYFSEIYITCHNVAEVLNEKCKPVMPIFFTSIITSQNPHWHNKIYL